MIPFSAKYRDTEISFFIPQGYDELTLRQLIELNRWDKKDTVKLISIITGMDYDVIYNSESTDIDEKIIPLLQWISKSRNLKLIPVPKKITIQEKEYEVPKDISVKTFGQKLSLQKFVQYANKEKLDDVECIPFALAIYFQPIITGSDFNEDEAKKLVPVMEKCNLMDGYAVGNFFLTSFLKSMSGNENTLRHSTITTRLMRALRNLNRLGRWLPLTRSHKATS